MNEAYEEMSVEELRRKVRDLGILKGTEIVGMNKAQCIEVLRTGKAPAPVSTGPITSPGSAIDEILKQFLAANNAVNPDQVREIIREELENRKPGAMVIEIQKQGETVTKITGIEHKMFPVIVSLLGCRDRSGHTIPVLLTGPAGSGKTTAAVRAAANALGLKYELISVSLSTSKSDIFGFVDAAGNYHPSVLYRCAKSGWLMIVDEFDACHAGIGTSFNAAFANRCVTFPNGETLEFHPDFRVVACANTFGTGADERYCGRNPLDAATLDRFVTLRIGYDEELERAFVGISASPDYAVISDGPMISVERWVDRVQRARAAIDALHLQHVISPRASIYGAAMIGAGFSQQWLDQSLLFKGLPADQRSKLQAAIGEC